MHLRGNQMTKRDPVKAALNKKIKEMTEELRAIEPQVMTLLNEPTQTSLTGRVGGKNAEFIDIKNEVILSPEAYASLWIRGFLTALELRRPLFPGDAYRDLLVAMQNHDVVRSYVITFLKRTYFRNIDALSRKRPRVEEAEVWIGQNNASYGLLVTPRFVNNTWENDKSEIRHFPQDYWTVGHVMETGLVVPGKDTTFKFSDVEKYLDFFRDVLVRVSGSPHEMAIAERYVDHVKAQPLPLKVPLLIPEFRYDGLAKAHKHRLDFTIIDPFTMQKVGFELSPWSTHGELTGTKKKTQGEINDEARKNFEKEMEKHKDFFRKHGVYALIFTDSDLASPDKVFAEMKKFLAPQRASQQLELQALDELSRFVV